MEPEKSDNAAGGFARTPSQNCWFNPEWKSKVDKSNVMDYFQQPANPFYDISCNNEILKRKNPQVQQLKEMIGVEYVTYQLAEPTCFVVRKQFRHGPIRITRLSDYHIVNGMIYETNDLHNFLNVRLKSFVRKIQSSFDESVNRVTFNTTLEYSWHIDSKPGAKQTPEIEQLRNEKPCTSFRRETVAMPLDGCEEAATLSSSHASNGQHDEDNTEATGCNRPE